MLDSPAHSLFSESSQTFSILLKSLVKSNHFVQRLLLPAQMGKLKMLGERVASPLPAHHIPGPHLPLSELRGRSTWPSLGP